MSELGSGNGTSYPGALDTDNILEVDSPNASKTKARADVPNDMGAAIIALETELGTNPAGTVTDVKTFLQTEHNTDGTHDTSVVVTLTDTQTLTNKTLTAPVMTTPASDDLTLSGAGIGSTPDANTLYKDNIILATCTFNGTGTPAYTANKFNFSADAITDNGNGDYTLTIDRDFAATTYAVQVTAGVTDLFGSYTTKAVGTIRIKTTNSSGADTDPADASVTIIGAQ
jgi:hypothetical protein